MPPEQTINILLIDDHPVVRMGFQTLLKMGNSSFVFHEAESRAEALDMVTRCKPRVALLDLTLSGVVDLPLIGELREISPNTAILVASMHDERLYAERAIRAGAKGYLMKNHAAGSIATAVQTVLDGGIWLSENMHKALMSRFLNPGASGEWERIATLSDRELEILKLIGLGLKKSEMAARVGLSANTIETYRTNLKRKLQIATGAELYRFAFLHFQNEGAQK